MIQVTQEKLGAIMGMKGKHISRIESGERQPTKIQAAFINFIAEKGQ
jgi:transcriptional regulator with XRE-family HTH domain